MLQMMRHPGTEHMGWFYSHMGSMIGGGIAFHTAFAVFGAQRLWDYSLEGALGDRAVDTTGPHRHSRNDAGHATLQTQVQPAAGRRDGLI